MAGTGREKTSYHQANEGVRGGCFRLLVVVVVIMVVMEEWQAWPTIMVVVMADHHHWHRGYRLPLSSLG